MKKIFAILLILTAMCFVACGGDDGDDGGSTGATEFITTWKTDSTGASNDNQITIPTSGDATYSYNVDWGDGSTSTNVTGDVTHTYDATGVVTVKIDGQFPRIYFNGGGDAEKLLTIENWGNVEWGSFELAFRGCTYLTYNATDKPDLSDATNMEFMFAEASSFNGAIGDWDVSKIESMGAMFTSATSFNQNLSSWDVSSVIVMASMFSEASSFSDHDLSGWNVCNVTIYSDFLQNAGSGNTEPNWGMACP